jgi:hypothetical protein
VRRTPAALIAHTVSPHGGRRYPSRRLGRLPDRIFQIFLLILEILTDSTPDVRVTPAVTSFKFTDDHADVPPWV